MRTTQILCPSASRKNKEQSSFLCISRLEAKQDFKGFHKNWTLSPFLTGWFFLVLSLKAWPLERMLWKLERMRKRFGCSGGTATKRSVVRVSGNWRRMLKRDRRKTGTSSATTGEWEACWTWAEEPHSGGTWEHMVFCFSLQGGGSQPAGVEQLFHRGHRSPSENTDIYFTIHNSSNNTVMKK